MEIFAKKQFGKLVPLHDSDYEALKAGVKDGEEVKIKISRPRNVLFHRKFFALLNLGYANQDQYDNFEKYRFVMVMKAGHFDAIKTDKDVVYMPRSISFAKMDQFTFEKLYDDMITATMEILDLEKEEIMSELETFF